MRIEERALFIRIKERVFLFELRNGHLFFELSNVHFLFELRNVQLLCELRNGHFLLELRNAQFFFRIEERAIFIRNEARALLFELRTCTFNANWVRNVTVFKQYSNPKYTKWELVKRSSSSKITLLIFSLLKSVHRYFGLLLTQRSAPVSSQYTSKTHKIQLKTGLRLTIQREKEEIQNKCTRTTLNWH